MTPGREGPGNHSWLPGILCAGLIVRLAAAFWFTPPLFSDDIDYVALGKSLAHGEGYHLDEQPTAYRPPGYPFFLALSFKIFEDSYVPIRIAQVLADMISCLLVFGLARRLFSEHVGLIAAGVFALFPIQILYVSILVTETIFTTLLLLFLWLCADEEASWKKGLLAGIVWGIGTLVRPTMLLLPAIVFAVRWLRGGKFQKNLLALVIISVSGFVILLPWLIRNYDQFGRVTMTSNTGVNFWIGSHSGANGSYSYPHDNPLSSIENEFERSDLGIELGLRFIRDHPLEYGVTLVKKWAHFLSVDYWLLLAMQWQPEFRSAPRAAVVFSKFPMASVLAIHLPFAAVLLLAAFGAICHAPQDFRKIIFLLSPCVYWLMVHLVFYAGARYRFPIVPIFMIGAAYGIDLVRRKKYIWTRGRAAAFCLFALLFTGGWTAERVLLEMKADSERGVVMTNNRSNSD